MDTGLIILIVLIVLVVIGIIYTISTQRKLVNLDELANNAMSQIGVQLNTRWDAVSALVKVADKYAAHEATTLRDVIAQRRVSGVKTADDVNAQQSAIGDVLTRLMALTEQYPELKASELYQSSMSSIKGYEENVRMSRMVYNDSVTKINRMVRQFPSSFVANMLHFGLRTYLEEDRKKKDFPEI